VVAASLGISAVLVAGPAALAAPAARPTTSALLTVAVLGLVYAAGNYVLYVLLVQTVGASRAAVTSYVAPAVAVVLGIVILGEPARAGLVAGLLLVVAGSWLATGGRLPPGLAPLRRSNLDRSVPPWPRTRDSRTRLAPPPRAEPSAP
jgi:drug/metabolite transporter (DMT)-like permease